MPKQVPTRESLRQEPPKLDLGDKLANEVYDGLRDMKLRKMGKYKMKDGDSPSIANEVKDLL